MTIGDTATHWGPVSRVLHAIGAALILILVVHGFWMTGFVPRGTHFPHYAWHASLGYALIALMFAWLFWRLGSPGPRLPEARAWERAAMSAGHWLLFAMVFVTAFSGWALAGTARQPLDSEFGLLRLPPIVNPDRSLHPTLGSWHSIAAWTLAGLVALHMLMVAWHWMVRKDGVMQRMFRSAPQ